MKPAYVTLWCAIALLIVAPLTLFFEIKLAGREAATQTLPLLGIAVVMWLSAVAETLTLKAIEANHKVQLQLKVMMLCKALRFMLATLMLIAYAVIADGDARLFAINLIVCYFAVTIVLTIGYTRRKKQTDHSSNSQSLNDKNASCANK